jgi:hypothetical protein
MEKGRKEVQKGNPIGERGLFMGFPGSGQMIPNGESPKH